MGRYGKRELSALRFGMFSSLWNVFFRAWMAYVWVLGLRFTTYSTNLDAYLMNNL
jgi:hypothetical protein